MATDGRRAARVACPRPAEPCQSTPTAARGHARAVYSTGPGRARSGGRHEARCSAHRSARGRDRTRHIGRPGRAVGGEGPRPTGPPFGRPGLLRVAARQLRRPAPERRLPRPTPAVRRAHAATRQHLRRRHRVALPARELRARGRDARRGHRPAGHDDRVRRVRRAAHHRQDARRPRVRGRMGHRAQIAACCCSSGAARRAVAVADVPGIDAFGLVTSGQIVRAERADRATRDRPGEPPRPHLRRQGAADPRRRAGRGRRRRTRTGRRTTSTSRRRR